MLFSRDEVEEPVDEAVTDAGAEVWQKPNLAPVNSEEDRPWSRVTPRKRRAEPRRTPFIISLAAEKNCSRRLSSPTLLVYWP